MVINDNGTIRTLSFYYDADGPFAVNVTNSTLSTTYYYVRNAQGDITAIVNKAGTAVVEYHYDAWGNILSIEGDYKAGLGVRNPLRYRGYVYDTETGLYYVSSRYYDPEIGRWINADSIIGVDDILGNNLFAYCDNNSVNKVDYSGKDGQTIDLGNGWKYRIDPLNTNTKTKRHIHIWNEKKEYIQNDDGSSHDDHRGESGKIPKWLNKKLIEKAGWDYNGNRKEFFEQTSFECWVEGTQYTFADGTTVFQPYNPYLPTRYSADSFEGVYFQGDTASSGTSNSTQVFYLPIIGPVTFPSFSFGFGLGSLPIPLLY